MALTAEDIYRVRFDRAPVGTRGYHEPAVDAFLNRVVATLEGEDEVTAEDVHNVSFARPPLGKRGYDQASVDHFLRLVESTLAGHPVAGGSVYLVPALEHTHTRPSLFRRKRS
ncbi:DivIVA domain-containing protein [Amycolatopsis nigrescens]|uniref:DivIVA domain-containing protein n=1 Tax=Amycolatopsis nigrescens TaxID=381445 RepID=UPI0003664058|nr:DivIVA domain-containing protein [Amycolatopsis nigrescens]